MVIIHKLDIFRDVHMAAGKAGSMGTLANGVLIAEPQYSLMKVMLVLA